KVRKLSVLARACLRVSRHVRLDPIIADTRWPITRVEHCINCQMSKHPGKVDELAMRVTKASAIHVSQFEDAMGSLQRFVTPPVSHHVKRSQWRDGFEAAVGKSAEEVGV